jgi:hypothetical protein
MISKRTVKTGWHLLLVGASIIEWQLAKTDFKKHLAGACAGWHFSAAVADFLDKEDA